MPAFLALSLLAAPQATFAQAPAAAAPAAVPVASPAVPASAAPLASVPTAPAAAASSATAEPAAAAIPAGYPEDHFKVAPGAYVPMEPTAGIGMPVAKGLDIQKQFSPTGEQAYRLHYALLWIMAIISIFVLGLLIWVMVRYNKRANPVPSKTSHNSLIEVVWTLVPVLVLVGIAVPSISLLAKQYKPAPDKALTIKATGNQWFWTYSYPDNGGIEVISNMLKDANDPLLKPGERARTEADGPEHLAADYRMVVPAGEPIRLQVTASDVIHSFAVPSLWFKLDGNPGQLNEKVLFVEKPGVYFGQCSELCGVRHGYMPIVVEALPRPEFNRWVLSQSGGVIDGTPKAEPAPAAAPAAPAAAPAPDAAASGAPASPAPGA
ncbi:MAG: cytochrome c oxidase subunit II [Novosphingobium sp.]